MKKKTTSSDGQLSMRWRMIGILVICWLIPISFMIGILGVYLAGNHSDMIVQNFRDQLAFNNQICVERLNGVVTASRKASYDRDILNAYQKYQHGAIDYLKAGKVWKEYLLANYQKNDAISSAILWLGPADDAEMFTVYNDHGGGSYQQIRHYREDDHRNVSELAETLGTKIGFLECGRELYLVRNLVNSHYEVQGTLVFALNKEYCFGSLLGFSQADGVHTRIGTVNTVLKKNEQLERREQDEDAFVEQGYEWLGGRLRVLDDQWGNGYRIHTSMLMQKEVTKYPFYGYQYVLGGMVLSLLPMLLLMLLIFRRYVSDPVNELCEGAHHMEQGELGYQIEEPMASAEFMYLRDSFNQMSKHLKEQFDKIYQEEIALREAKIMALQSHINPHFMNNTLEIINWEARLGGNYKVSKMIEALSKMLDAAMDRRKRPQVRLAEEMGYVSSYLYIMKERLGKRLTVEIEIPEELMEYMVPRLILQPVIENAIEHGVVPNGSGVVVLRGYRDENYLYLVTINDGGLTNEDKARVERLLDPHYNTGKEPSGNLGIANVNQRLRILYGEPCGLTIVENEERKVIAKLTMPCQKWQTEVVEMNKTEQ